MLKGPIKNPNNLQKDHKIQAHRNYYTSTYQSKIDELGVDVNPAELLWFHIECVNAFRALTRFFKTAELTRCLHRNLRLRYNQ